MPTPPKRKSEMVFVRHSRTGDLSVRPASNFIPRPLSTMQAAPASRHLHYANKEHSKVCYCNDSTRHRYSSPIDSESSHLAADLTHYLKEVKLESRLLSDFHSRQAKKRLAWACDGVNVEELHYATKEKDVVCRCTNSNNHGHGPVRNPEIVHMCANFFRANKEKKTCTKMQWRSSTKTDTDEQARRHTVNTRTPRPPKMEEQLRGGPKGEPDIPERVWYAARPSVWNGRRGSETVQSTPLGTAFSPRFPVAGGARAVRGSRLVPEALPPCTSIPFLRPNVVLRVPQGTNDAIATFAHTPVAELPTLRPNIVLRVPQGTDDASAHVAELPTLRPYIELRVPQRTHDASAKPASTPLAELPNLRPNTEIRVPQHTYNASVQSESTELPTIPSPRLRHVHSATLRELEGRPAVDSPRDRFSVRTEVPSDYRSELPCVQPAQELTGKRPSLHFETSCTSSPVSQPSSYLDDLFAEVHDAVCLPNQEELLLQHAVVCERGHPALPSNCLLCKQPLNDGRARTIQLPGCGHILHEHCLVADFRIQDQSIGRCSICDFALCERGLLDRIDTDRQAIFGSQSTPMTNKVCVEFAQRGEDAIVHSEEELAATQLRLLKDYVEIHIEDVWRRWKADGVEPDWYEGIIFPTFTLFKAWNVPSQYSPLFSDRDAFLKLVAWAEVVRSVHATLSSVKARVDDAPLPPLADLHRKFIWAKDRFDAEMKTWSTNHRGEVDCEKVALDVYNLAVKTDTNVC